jgi:hypothetical protein
VNFSTRSTGNHCWPLRVILFLLVLVLAGCGRENINVYQVPRVNAERPANADPHAGMMPGNMVPPPSARPRLTWKLPAGWTEQPLSSMRAASFDVTGPNGQTADVAVIPLPGVSGRDFEMVNMWRAQVRLEPIQASEMEQLMTNVAVGSAKGRLIDMAGKTPPEGAKSPLRVLVAMLDRDGTTWFFKMTGDNDLVAQQKSIFVDFLSSVRFESAEAPMALPPSHPPIGGAASPPVAAAGGQTKPAWEVPPGWKEEPPTQMLLAKFSATDGDARAEITVSAFPGDVGGLLANVNRWRQQLQLPAIDEAGLAQAVTQLDAGAGNGSLVDLTGTGAKTSQKARLVGVALPHAGQTWFFKLMGDDSVVAREKDAFVKFVQAIKFPDAP